MAPLTPHGAQCMGRMRATECCATLLSTSCRISSALSGSAALCFIGCSCIGGLQGFLRSWEANGLREKVVQRVNAIVSQLAHSVCNETKVRVYVTGP